MPMKKRKLAIYLILFMILTDLSFAANISSAATKKTELNKKSLFLMIKQTYSLKLNGINKKKVKWSSSNKKIASVKNGVVTAKKVGKCTITAKYSGKKYKCTVRIQKGSPKAISLTIRKEATDNRTLHLTIANKTDAKVYTGTNFTLEKLENNTWKPVSFKENIGFDALALIIPPKQTLKKTISLDSYYNNLTKGKYRIMKEIYPYYEAYAEFTLD